MGTGESGGLEGGAAGDRAEEGIYEERIRRFRSRKGEVRSRSGRTGRQRLVLFVASVALFLGAERTEDPVSTTLLLAGVAAVVGFFFLVRRHRHLRRAERRLEMLVGLNEEALARRERRWDDLPPTAAVPDLRSHPYAEDLDIVGASSLERLLSTVSTGPGARTLRAWLLAPADLDEAADRRNAVEELADRVDFRQELAARARLAGLGRDDPTHGFLSWAEEEGWLDARRWLVWTARTVPPLTLLLLSLQLAGLLAGAWWILGILAGLIFLGTRTAEIGEVMDTISAGERFLAGYGDPLELLEGMEARSPRLARVRELARSGEGSASGALRRLERWITIGDVRHNDLIHVPLQVVFFWDVHVLRELERWKERNGRFARSWLLALGEAEALAALGSLRGDHPEWCFPTGREGAPRGPERGRIDPVGKEGGAVEAEGLAHPLLPPDRSVANDVTVGPAGTFLLLTGSNMSGKSTLMRSIGMNCVLAQAGGPVCARSFRLPPVQVVTSMRTEDSLSQGVSSFMAELRRVALVVETARKSRDGLRVLYLLDEPLQGTNEAERRTAVRIVLEQLLESGAIGAVATHDLLLHETEKLKEAATPVHFTSEVRETDGELRLTFEYKLRPGPATSTNALDLLRLAGLAGGPSTRPSESSSERVVEGGP